MSEKTRTVDVKFSLTVTVQQLDLPGIDPWVVNGKACKDKAAAMKEITSLMNGGGKTRTILSLAAATAEVRSWTKPYTLQDVQLIPGIGPDRGATILANMVEYGHARETDGKYENI